MMVLVHNKQQQSHKGIRAGSHPFCSQLSRD